MAVGLALVGLATTRNDTSVAGALIMPYGRFLATAEARGDIRPDQFKGSWAGAFGSTQFMPTAFKRYAVDFDGDGRRLR